MSGERPIRILHVLGAMNRGGVETWLMHVLRNIHSDQFEMDFLAHTEKPAEFDEEIASLGRRILRCTNPHRPFSYLRRLTRILREEAAYDVVHCHAQHFSGWVLRAAFHAGVPVRVAHSHNDLAPRDRRPSLIRRAYLAVAKRGVSRFATHGLAVSETAASALFGREWKADPRWRVLYCGVDMSPFRQPVDKEAVRAELGIPRGAFVVGHVGRFAEQKNHAFLVEVAAEIAKRDRRAWFLLVGDGPLRSIVQREVFERGLGERFVFAGVRSDVPRLMLGAMDAFLLPSLHEGLGLVLLEAQAAGVPCVFSDVVPREADLAPALLCRLSLDMPPAVWADATIQRLVGGNGITQTEALSVVQQSPFVIEASVRALEAFYCAANRRRQVA